MPSSSDAVFVDANVLIYFLDASSMQHQEVIATLELLVNGGAQLYTSHHVLEEVLYIVSRLSSDATDVESALKQIATLPAIRLIEPPADFKFAFAYTRLYRKTQVGINDTLLLQLMRDTHITQLFSYDMKMLAQAKSLGIQSVAPGH